MPESENKPQNRALECQDSSLINKQDYKQNVTSEISETGHFKPEDETEITLLDIKRVAILKFGSINQMANKMHCHPSRLSQIFNGLVLPKKNETIKKLAEVLQIDVVVLTQVFSKVRVKD